jgi:WD40 repeat protein
MSNLHCYACGLPITLDDTMCARCNSPLLLYNIYQMQRILQPENDNGTVYLARHRRLNADLVVKQAPLSLAGYIRNEAQILQSLRRRLDFTPHVYDFRDDDQHVVLIMEFIEGQTLDHVYPQQPWPIHEVDLFVDELLQHLEELHAADIIHRDLKPQNIIRRPNGNYALIDFNVAKHKGEKTEYIGHTRRYAPPEQLPPAKKRRDSSPKVLTDERSDLYSLAATAYELLTGQLFVLQSDIPPVLRGEAVPAELRAALTRMLASDMAARPPSATEALQLLRPNRVLSPKGRYATNPLADTAPPLGNLKSPVQIDAEAATAWAAAAGSHTAAVTAGRVADGASTIWEPAVEASHVFPAEAGYGRITGIAWSPIAPELAIATARGVRMYNASARAERMFHRASAPIRSIGYAGNGQALAWVMADRAYVYGLNDGICAYDLPAYPEHTPGALVCAPKAQALAIATEAGVQVFDIAQKTFRYRCDGAIDPHLTVSSETSDRIITVSEQHITIWRGNPSEKLFTIPDNITVRPIIGLALTPDGRTLAVASASAVEIWNNRSIIGTFTSTERIRAVALSPNGKRLALLTFQSIRIYNLETKRITEPTQAADIAPRCFQLAFDKDSTYLAMATPGMIRIWDLNLRKMIETLSYTDNPRYLAFTPNGELLASVGHDIQIHDIQNHTSPIKPHAAERAGKIYHGIAFAHDGQMLAVACGDAITLWQRRTIPKSAQTFMATAVGETRPPNAAEINPWRKVSRRSCKAVQAHSLMFARLPAPDLMKIDHAKIDIWPIAATPPNPQSRAVLFPLLVSGSDQQDLAHLYDIALAPSGWIAATSANKTVHIWDVDDDDKAVRPIQLDFLPNSVALSPDGQLLAAVAHDTLQVWDVQSKKLIYTAPDAEYGAERVVFAPDSVTFATTHHAELRIWRMDGPMMRLVYRAREHTDTITDIAFADDLRTFASASDDGTIRVWTGKLTHTNTVPPPPPPDPLSVKSTIVVPPQPKLTIFLCHVTEDQSRIIGLSQRLRELGFKIWDASDITPGQQWQHRIRRMIEQSDIFIACLSNNLINKSRASFAHDEIDYALKFAETLPEDSIYIIPLRLGGVNPPEPLQRWQWVDYFDDHVPEQLVAALEKRAQTVAHTKRTPTDPSPKPNPRKHAEIRQLKADLDLQRDALRVLQLQINYVGRAHARVDQILDANNRRKAVWRIKARLEKLRALYTSDLIDEFEE